MSGDERPDVTLAAGLLEADGTLTSDLTVETATDRLTDLLNPSSLWVRAGNGRPRVDHMLAPPRWVSPAFVVETDLATTLHTAWTSALADHPTAESVLRITVGGADDAEQLATLATGTAARVVPTIATHPHRFTWKWPLRVAVADGPRAQQWATELRAGPFAGELFEVRVEPVGHDTSDDVDILIVDAAQPRSASDVVTPYQATCVMMVGAGDQTAATLLERAGEARSAIAVGLVSGGVGWFPEFLEQLAHDFPVDVAITGVLPDARVAGDPQLTGLTAVGRWATELGQRVDTSPDDVPDIDLGALVDTTAFDHERQGAREVTAAARHLEGAGIDTVVEFRLAQAAAAPEPPPMAAEAPAAPIVLPSPAPAPAPPTAPTAGPVPTATPEARTRRAKPGRQLMAEVTQNGKVCTRALEPNSDHQVEVRIAVPVKRTAGLEFPEAAVPGGTVVELMVDVSSPDGKVHGRAPLVLGTTDRTTPSSVAVIPFTTGADGTLLRLKITVLHQQRPIQAAELVASVRATSSRHDTVQLLPLQLTSAPEPDPTGPITSADAAVDATTSILARIGEDRRSSVELSNLSEILDLLEQEASRVLGTDTAPGSLGSPEALDLLVILARRGSQLRRKLEDLGLDDARTISVLVKYDSAVVPFELAYDGPAPEDTAELCEHATSPPAAGEGCDRTTSRRVCPYAFWGMHRVIARTIESRPKRRRPTPRPQPGPLALRPVLYAAAERADRESPPESRPSDLLENALAKLVGREKLIRVTNWRAWKGAVRRLEPQMLVVLGHTEIERSEATLEIGRKSRLHQPSVTHKLLGSTTSTAPVVVLLACASAVTGDPFGGLPATFTDHGAAAVVATLTKLKGQHGAEAAVAVVSALRTSTAAPGSSVGAALTAARRQLVADGLLVGLLLVAHGEIDVQLTA